MQRYLDTINKDEREERERRKREEQFIAKMDEDDDNLSDSLQNAGGLEELKQTGGRQM